MPIDNNTPNLIEINGWNKWGKHVVLELERQEERDGALDDKIDGVKDIILEIKEELIANMTKLDKDIATRINGLEKESAIQRYKVGVWGAGATLITALGIVIGLARAGIISFG